MNKVALADDILIQRHILVDKLAFVLAVGLNEHKCNSFDCYLLVCNFLNLSC